MIFCKDIVLDEISSRLNAKIAVNSKYGLSIKNSFTTIY